MSFDITWEGSFPALEEQPHFVRRGPHVILQSSRFAQVGTWSGVLSVDGEDRVVEPSTWLGSRDRSWGIRPSGDKDPTNQWDEGLEPRFWWVYVPLRFDRYSIVVIADEQSDGYRTLNDATRIWPDGRIEQLGWPRFEIRYRSGTRHPEGAVIHCTAAGGEPLTIEVETRGGTPLHLGSGYGDSTWSHGQWRGHGWSERIDHDLDDPAVTPRIPFGNIDHVARAVCGGDEGWGLFEHGTIGRHAPTGFADVTSVAP
jgi:hypothetical protein